MDLQEQHRQQRANMVHNLPIPGNSIPPLPGYAAPRELERLIGAAQQSDEGDFPISKNDINDEVAHSAAEYAQYTCFVKIDCLEPLLIRINDQNRKFFSGRHFTSSILKGFRYRAGKTFRFMDDSVESLEPKEIGRMTVDEAKDYVLEMVEVTWKEKQEFREVQAELRRLEEEARNGTLVLDDSGDDPGEDEGPDDSGEDPSYPETKPRRNWDKLMPPPPRRGRLV